MKKASSQELGRSLTVAHEMARAGMAFICIPFHTIEERDALIMQAETVLKGYVARAEEEENKIAASVNSAFVDLMARNGVCIPQSEK